MRPSAKARKANSAARGPTETLGHSSESSRRADHDAHVSCRHFSRQVGQKGETASRGRSGTRPRFLESALQELSSDGSNPVRKIGHPKGPPFASFWGRGGSENLTPPNCLKLDLGPLRDGLEAGGPHPHLPWARALEIAKFGKVRNRKVQKIASFRNFGRSIPTTYLLRAFFGAAAKVRAGVFLLCTPPYATFCALSHGTG